MRPVKHERKGRKSIRRCNEDLRIIERASARRSRRFICSATVRIIMPLAGLLPPGGRLHGLLHSPPTLAYLLEVELILYINRTHYFILNVRTSYEGDGNEKYKPT